MRPVAHRHRPSPRHRPARAWVVAIALAGLCAACGIGASGTAADPSSSTGSPASHGSAPGSPTTRNQTTITPSSASAAVVQVVGLGDSVTAGTACPCEDFVQLYATGLARRWQRVVHETNLGQGGLTSAGLLVRIEDNPSTRSQVAGADVVLVTIGANDLVPALRAWDDGSGQDAATCGGACETADLERVEENLRGVLRDVQRLRGGRPTVVLVTTYWNVFEDGDVAQADRGAAYLRWSDELTRRLNDGLERAARAEKAVPVDLYAPFKAEGHGDPTPLLAGDGDHPNAAGHRVIASALLAATPAPPTGSRAS